MAAPPLRSLAQRHLRGLPELDRPLVMGVVNVTPDSFSDGGDYLRPDAAVARGLRMLADGADLLDIGGESTRPGATRPLVAEELARVVPVVTELAAHGAALSIDTMRAEVAVAALDAGAVVVNDVSGGLADPDILRVVAERDAAYVAMHWRGHADTMQKRASYVDVVGEVRDELRRRVDDALAVGVPADRIAVDPGLGFAKTADHNWALLQHLTALDDMGLPILLGSSRKSFLGSLLADADGNPRPVLDREGANVALTTLAGILGVWAVRVHEARASVDALKVVSRWRQDAEGQDSSHVAEPGKVAGDE
jgi:dihydropteroate synthase